jgi:hypothetical protein
VSEGTRTPDRLDHNQELYQLSYAHHVDAGSLASAWQPDQPPPALTPSRTTQPEPLRAGLLCPGVDRPQRAVELTVRQIVSASIARAREHDQA